MDDRTPSSDQQDPNGSRRRVVLIRTALIYLAVGGILSQATLLLVRNTALPPAVFQAVVSLLLLGLPLVLIGIAGLEERFGEQAYLEAMARSPWTSAPMALVLGAAALAVGASGWVAMPGGFGISRVPSAASTSAGLIGVLPPRVDSDVPEDQALADQRRTSLARRISALGSFTVLPDSLVDLYRNPAPTGVGDPAPEASALLVQETVVRTGDTVAVHAQVVDSRTGEVIWEGGVNDPFRSVTEVSDGIIIFLMATTEPPR